MFVLCCLTKGRMMVNWQSAHCVSVGSWLVSLTLKGPFGFKQHKLPVIVNASVIARVLPHIFKPSPLYTILFRALCYSCFPAGSEENRFLTRETERFGPAGLLHLMNVAACVSTCVWRLIFCELKKHFLFFAHHCMFKSKSQCMRVHGWNTAVQMALSNDGNQREEA